ncbi:MAG: zinc ABC transporter substrate-binding protein [Candidatus Zixiibacteriota bacterium]|nr:MAG: zinc ABC transporter substrate-binding protein [candidate division Zixibacteria bacterium]
MEKHRTEVTVSKRRIRQVAVLLGLLVLLLAPPAGATIKAFVSIAPHSFFVQEIGGAMVEVEILVPPGQSPATFEPSPQQLARLAVADVLFTTGVAFEKRLIGKIAGGFDNLTIVPTHAGIELRPIERHSDADHDHGGTEDPHVWLDPKLASRQAMAIADALKKLDPSSAEIFENNLDRVLKQIDSVDAIIEQMLAPVRGRTIYVFHPAYGYFADAYGLKQVAIETGGKQPSARQLAAITEQANADSVNVVFIQPQFSARQAEAIGQSIGARVVTLDPLSANYSNNLVDMASKIADALASSQSSQERAAEKQHN